MVGPGEWTRLLNASNDIKFLFENLLWNYVRGWFHFKYFWQIIFFMISAHIEYICAEKTFKKIASN